MKSAVLMVIGAALLIAAFVVNRNISAREHNDQEGSMAGARLRYAISGKWDYKKSDKQDRMPVYALAGIGAISILAGIVTLGSGKKGAKA